jgi:hypothetical protein
MNRLISTSLLGLAGLSLLIFSPQSTMALVPLTTAVIRNSGSTNTIGYRIFVTPSGQASYVDGNGSGQGQLSQKLTKRFFRDLKAAEPLSNLPVEPCVKSVSFGTTTTVSLGGEQSPDISCPSDNDQVQDLEEDVTAIAKALNVVNVPNSEGTPLPPQNF